MTGWEIFWVIIALAILIALIMNAADLMRYMKIRRM